MQDKVYIFYTILLWNSKLNKSRIKRHVAAFWNLCDRPRPIEITHTNVLNITLKRVLMVLYHLHLYILGKISTLDILLWNSSVDTWFGCRKLVVSGNICWKYFVTNFLIWIPIKQPQLVRDECWWQFWYFGDGSVTVSRLVKVHIESSTSVSLRISHSWSTLDHTSHVIDIVV